MRVLLLRGRQLLMIATRSAAAVESLKQLLQISHGDRRLERSGCASVKRGEGKRPTEQAKTRGKHPELALTLLCPKFAWGWA